MEDMNYIFGMYTVETDTVFLLIKNLIEFDNKELFDGWIH